MIECAKHKLLLAGSWHIRCLHPDGRLAWAVMFRNAMTILGINDLLNAGFGNGTQRTWYFGLVDNAAFAQMVAGDTMASHVGWTEATSYSESTRPAWGAGATAAGGLLTNSTAATFTITGSMALRGAFVTTDNTKGGTGGILWAAGQFPAVQNVISGQVLQATYRLTAAEF